MIAEKRVKVGNMCICLTGTHIYYDEKNKILFLVNQAFPKKAGNQSVILLQHDSTSVLERVYDRLVAFAGDINQPLFDVQVEKRIVIKELSK